jgi:hypothetical protein
MWQRQIPPQPRGEVWSHMTRGSAGAHLSRKAMFEAVGHMTAPEPNSAGRRGLKP